VVAGGGAGVTPTGITCTRPCGVAALTLMKRAPDENRADRLTH